MGRRFLGDRSIRKCLAIASLLVAWLMTLGSEGANAQALPPGCALSSPTAVTSTLTRYCPGASVTSSCNALTGACSCSCNGQAFTGQLSGLSATLTSLGCGGTSVTGAISLQNSAQAARQASQVSMTAVQSQLQSIRDSIQAGRSRAVTTGRLIGFAAEPSSDRVAINPLYDGSFQDLLGYARTDSKSPLRASPPPAPVAPAPVWSVWGQGFGDWEKRTGSSDGIDIGRRTLTGGGLVGLDVTFSNFTSPSGALVLGVLGAGMRSTTHNNDGSTSRVDGPGTGFYAIYVNGGFSTDATWKGDFLTVAPSTLPTSVGLNN